MAKESSSFTPSVVVVHGDRVIASRYCRSLRLWGFASARTDDAEEALRTIAETMPVAVVLDLTLPGLDPLDLAMALREYGRTRDVAIIALAESLSEDAIELAIARGCDRVIGIDADADELAAEVESATGRRARRHAA